MSDQVDPVKLVEVRTKKVNISWNDELIKIRVDLKATQDMIRLFTNTDT